MLLDARIDDKTHVYIDCETAGGFAKSDAASEFDPEQAIDHIVRLSAAMALRLAAATDQLPADARSAIQLTFSVKVQGDGVVCIGRNADDGQVKVQVTRRG